MIESEQLSNQESESRDDKVFQLIKKQEQTSRTIIIATATVMIFRPVLGTVANFVTGLLLGVSRD